MAAQQNNKDDLKAKMDVIDESLRSKYLKIVESLSLNELKKFNKSTYQQLVLSDFCDLVPEAQKKELEDRSLYISNMLNNQVPKIRGNKSQTNNKKQNNRKTRTSMTEKEPEEQNPKTPITKNNVTTNSNKDTKQLELSDSVFKALDDTMMGPDVSINTTVTQSFLDSTYDLTANHDDSVTELETVQQSTPGNKNTTKRKLKDIPHETNNELQDSDSSESTCIETCSVKGDLESIRCNMCMKWFHTKCVGIKDIDAVGAWVCACCRVIPQTVNNIQSKIQILLENTNTIMETFSAFTERVENKFENLSDRITAISNQYKCNDESSTSALSDMRQEICSLKTEVDKKATNILSKSQSIFDKVKITTDLVSSLKATQEKMPANDINKSTSQANSKNQKTVPKQATSPDQPILIDITETDQSEIHSTGQIPPTKLHDLTFITGSCILKSIETRFLNDKVRVKSFNNSTIATLQEKLSKMDLSRYQNVVLHAGGYDVDKKIDQPIVQSKISVSPRFSLRQGMQLVCIRSATSTRNRHETFQHHFERPLRYTWGNFYRQP